VIEALALKHGNIIVLKVLLRILIIGSLEDKFLEELVAWHNDNEDFPSLIKLGKM